MRITSKSDSNALNTNRSTRRLEQTHPRDDDRVSFFTEGNQHLASEFYQRSDCLVAQAKCQLWGQEEDPTKSITYEPVRTTFYSNDLPQGDDWRQKKAKKLWKKQMGIAHTWDLDSKNIQREEATLRRCDSILQHCNVPRRVRIPTLSRVHQTNLNCFSSHHAGADGACIGFALLEMYNDPTEAKTSEIAKVAATTIPSLDEDTVERVIDYVFRKYEEDS